MDHLNLVFSLGCLFLDLVYLPNSAPHSSQENSAAPLHERASESDRKPTATGGPRTTEASSHGASRPGPAGPGVSL